MWYPTAPVWSKSDTLESSVRFGHPVAMVESLPIEALRGAFFHEIKTGPVVVSSPTGSGKSTQIPRWCAQLGRVVVVEPRRVACRSLAVRVAELEGVQLGGRVGYRVRDDSRASAKTQITFMTPGVALRLLAETRMADVEVVIVDEFHERSLDTDLLFALFIKRFKGKLVVMSATLDGDRVAGHLGGVHLSAKGRLFPVERRYLPGRDKSPDGRGLEARIMKALDASREVPGDVLVFLPGKAEIAAAMSAVQRRPDCVAVALHGGLSLDEQAEAFKPNARRKVVLATNVAETSVTIPGIGVVIDSGLARRTRYHGGRGFLTLMPIAQDSADQRAGRAGRTGPGVCFRLWQREARLAPHTPPEIYREALAPLVFGAAACGASVSALPFLDAPKDHALETARSELWALGALNPAGDGLTEIGRTLFGLPLDVGLGRLLVEARGTAVEEDMVDLVSVLAVGRQVFQSGHRPENPEDDLREGGCDATAFIRALRIGRPDRHLVRGFTLNEARRISARLRKAFKLPRLQRTDRPIDRRTLALIALRADPRLGHIIRRRKRNIAWSNGGTEVGLGRDCALNAVLETPEGNRIEACVVFESRALGKDLRQTQILVTCAMPAPMQWLVQAGLGRDRVASVSVGKGKRRLVARIERVLAKKVLSSVEVEPEGPAAREALAKCFLSGRLWPKTLRQTTDRLEAAGLQARLDAAAGKTVAPALGLEAWVEARIETLGFECGADLELLSADDLLADALDPYLQVELDRLYPRLLEFSDATLSVEYDLRRRKVVLTKIGGQRKGPPPLSWLPRFAGFRIEYRHGNVVRELRAR